MTRLHPREDVVIAVGSTATVAVWLIAVFWSLPA